MPPTAAAGASAACGDAAPEVPQRVWRLTDQQYNNVIRDLVDLPGLPRLVTSTGGSAVFVRDPDLFTVDDSTVFQYQSSAEALATAFAADMPRLLGCPADAACAWAWLQTFTSRAFRRKLATQETLELKTIFDSAQAEGVASQVRRMVGAVLQAPSFLYRTELGSGAGGAVAELTSDELASALSFLFLDSMPDPELWAAAQADTLKNPDIFKTQLSRLLALPQVRENLTSAVLDWLQLEDVLKLQKDAQLYPEWSPTLQASLASEARTFINDLLWTPGGTLRKLLTTNRTTVDQSSAAVYGLPPPAQGTAVVELPATERAGLLTLPALLARLSSMTQGSVVHRGLFVRRVLLCQQPPPPPESVDTNQFKNGDERELAAQRAATQPCGTCHAIIDAPGLALMQYDAIGRFRPLDAASQLPIDVNASLTGTDVDGPINGGAQLAEKLAASDAVSACVARQILQFVIGQPRLADSSCAAQKLNQLFSASSGEIADLFAQSVLLADFKLRSLPQNP